MTGCVGGMGARLVVGGLGETAAPDFLAGGFFAVPFLPFLLGSAVGRSMRFYLVACLSHYFGPRAAELFLTYFNKITLVLPISSSSWRAAPLLRTWSTTPP